MVAGIQMLFGIQINHIHITCNFFVQAITIAVGMRECQGEYAKNESMKNGIL